MGEGCPGRPTGAPRRVCAFQKHLSCDSRAPAAFPAGTHCLRGRWASDMRTQLKAEGVPAEENARTCGTARHQRDLGEMWANGTFTLQEVQHAEGHAERTIKVQRARSRAGDFCSDIVTLISSTQNMQEQQTGGHLWVSVSQCQSFDMKGRLVFVMGKALGTVGCSAVSLASAPSMPAAPIPRATKCLQTLPSAPGEQNCPIGVPGLLSL